MCSPFTHCHQYYGVFKLGSKPICVNPPGSCHLYRPIICGWGILLPWPHVYKGHILVGLQSHMIDLYKQQLPGRLAHVGLDPSPNMPKIRIGHQNGISIGRLRQAIQESAGSFTNQQNAMNTAGGLQ